MSFIPAVHNFDDRAIHPEAVRFYIALVFVLLIPKALSIRNWLVKHPVAEMRQYVITPLTQRKPASSSQVASDTWMTKEEIAAQPTVERSIVSRLFWSSMVLLFTAGMLWVLVDFGYGSQDNYVKRSDNLIATGGHAMWFRLSLTLTTFAGLLMAISMLITQDYIKWFLSFFSKK